MALFVMKLFSQLMNFVVLALIEKPQLPTSCIHLFSAFHKLTRKTKDVQIVDWIQFWFKGPSRYQLPSLRINMQRISSKLLTIHNLSRVIDNDYAIKIKDN
ncbi:hypothetical protein ACH5RR_018338, partial [Cinchona calisaya]